MRAPVNTFTGRKKAEGPSPLLKPLTILALVLIGVFSFAALFVLIGYGDELRDKEKGQATPVSSSAIGYAGIVQLLEDINFDVELDTKPFKSTWNTKNRLRVYTPSNQYMGAKFESFDANDPKLIVLPKWLVTELKNRPGWVRKHWASSIMRVNSLEIIIGEAGEGVLLDFIKEEDVDIPVKMTVDENTREADLDGLQFLALHKVISKLELDDEESETSEEKETPEDDNVETAGDDSETLADKFEALITPEVPLYGNALPMEPIISTVRDQAILIKLPNTRTYVLSDPDLLNTQGIASLTRAKLGVEILETIIRREALDPYAITFDLSIHGVETKPNLIKLMTQPPFLAATLCLLGAAMLIGWQGFARFGDPQNLPPDYSQGPASLAKTSAAFLASTGRLGSMGNTYAQMTRRQVMRKLGLTGMHSEVIEKRLAARETLRKISPKFEDLKHISASEGAMGFTARAQALAKWKEEMIREP